MSYDSYQSKRDRIFRMVTTSRSRSNGETGWQHSYAPARSLMAFGGISLPWKK